jgi:Tfp pilus assembly protein PilF
MRVAAASLAALFAVMLALPAAPSTSTPTPMADAAYVLYQQAMEALKNGDLKTALSDIDGALALQGDSAQLFVARGAIEDRSGDDAAAIADCTHAISLDPQSESAYAMRGQAERAASVGGSPSTAAARLKPSIDDLTQAIALLPKDPVVLWLRGLDRFDAGDVAGSIDDFTASIAATPKYAQPYLARAHAYQQLGKTPLAAADLQEAVTLFSAQGDAHDAQVAKAELAALEAAGH